MATVISSTGRNHQHDTTSHESQPMPNYAGEYQGRAAGAVKDAEVGSIRDIYPYSPSHWAHSYSHFFQAQSQTYAQEGSSPHNTWPAIESQIYNQSPHMPPDSDYNCGDSESSMRSDNIGEHNVDGKSSNFIPQPYCPQSGYPTSSYHGVYYTPSRQLSSPPRFSAPRDSCIVPDTQQLTRSESDSGHEGREEGLSLVVDMSMGHSIYENNALKVEDFEMTNSSLTTYQQSKTSHPLPEQEQSRFSQSAPTSNFSTHISPGTSSATPFSPAELSSVYTQSQLHPFATQIPPLCEPLPQPEFQSQYPVQTHMQTPTQTLHSYATHSRQPIQSSITQPNQRSHIFASQQAHSATNVSAMKNPPVRLTSWSELSGALDESAIVTRDRRQTKTSVPGVHMPTPATSAMVSNGPASMPTPVSKSTSLIASAASTVCASPSVPASSTAACITSSFTLPNEDHNINSNPNSDHSFTPIVSFATRAPLTAKSTPKFRLKESTVKTMKTSATPIMDSLQPPKEFMDDNYMDEKMIYGEGEGGIDDGKGWHRRGSDEGTVGENGSRRQGAPPAPEMLHLLAPSIPASAHELSTSSNVMVRDPASLVPPVDIIAAVPMAFSPVVPPPAPNSFIPESTSASPPVFASPPTVSLCNAPSVLPAPALTSTSPPASVSSTAISSTTTTKSSKSCALSPVNTGITRAPEGILCVQDGSVLQPTKSKPIPKAQIGKKRERKSVDDMGEDLSLGGGRKKGKEKQKPTPLACWFCRKRKIACGGPLPGSGNTACNQCARRSQECQYPPGSRRGQRNRKKPSHSIYTSSDPSGGSSTANNNTVPIAVKTECCTEGFADATGERGVGGGRDAMYVDMSMPMKGGNIGSDGDGGNRPRVKVEGLEDVALVDDQGATVRG